MITTIAQLVKRVCANYDRTYGENECSLRTDGCNDYIDNLKEEQSHCPCLVLNGKPCKWFRHKVLPPSDYQHCPNYDLQNLRLQYAQIDLTFTAGVSSQRTCECGVPLLPRMRLCEKCKIRNRRMAYRESKKKVRT